MFLGKGIHGDTSSFERGYLALEGKMPIHWDDYRGDVQPLGRDCLSPGVAIEGCPALGG